MNQSEQHGHDTQNKTREERVFKEEEQRTLFCETHQDSGSVEGKDYIVYFENSYHQRSPFVIKEVTTVSELLQKICDRFPEICCESLQLRVFQSRYGTTPRKELFDYLPLDKDTLFITFSLRKHPLIGILKK